MSYMIRSDVFPHQSVRLVGYTQAVGDGFDKGPEELIAYCARVSSNNQDNPNIKGLLSYMKRNAHWSPFEMANATIEIVTTRDIARQILRHNSFRFQEFSTRYAKVDTEGFVLRKARLQDLKNRQNSLDTASAQLAEEFEEKQEHVAAVAAEAYTWMLENGIAKEQARAILPEGMTPSRLYMNGTIRSWMHYIDLRDGNGTQAEHADIARMCRSVLEPVFPLSIGQAHKEE